MRCSWKPSLSHGRADRSTITSANPGQRRSRHRCRRDMCWVSTISKNNLNVMPVSVVSRHSTPPALERSRSVTWADQDQPLQDRLIAEGNTLSKDLPNDCLPHTLSATSAPSSKCCRSTPGIQQITNNNISFSHILYRHFILTETLFSGTCIIACFTHASAGLICLQCLHGLFRDTTAKIVVDTDSPVKEYRTAVHHEVLITQGETVTT